MILFSMIQTNFQTVDNIAASNQLMNERAETGFIYFQVIEYQKLPYCDQKLSLLEY